MYNALTIAAWFVANTDRASGDSITNLKLQKLIYYAQAWSLVLNNKALFKDRIKAWAHGPVVPSVYHAYNQHGFKDIPHESFTETLDEESLNVLNQVKQVYGIYGGKFLENLTHSEMPWIKARGGLPPEAKCDSVITHDSMKEFYGQKLKKK